MKSDFHAPVSGHLGAGHKEKKIVLIELGCSSSTSILVY
jgi:hypothetical protein